MKRTQRAILPHPFNFILNHSKPSLSPAITDPSHPVLTQYRSSDPPRLASSGTTSGHLASITVAGRVLLQELRLNLAVAQCAMTKFERAKGRLKSLVLASLASVVLFGQDGLSTGDARAEMTTALATVYVELGDQGLAARFRTLEFLLLLVCRWMATEKLEGQVLVLLSLLWSQCIQPLKLNKGL